MSKIQDYIDFVNEQKEYQIGKSVYYQKRDDHERQLAYLERAKVFEDLEDFLISKVPPKSGIYITPADIEGLPQELIDQLNLNSPEFKDFVLVDVIDSLGGIGSIDKILIELYKKSGEIENRNKLMNRLYRMSAKGLIYSDPTKKGIYSNNPFQKLEQVLEEVTFEDEDDVFDEEFDESDVFLPEDYREEDYR